MKTPKPAKRPAKDFTDDLTPAPPKPDPLSEDDAELAVLDKIKVDDLDEAPPAQVLERIPEAKRGEASAALKARWRRMRQYVSGASDELDW